MKARPKRRAQRARYRSGCQNIIKPCNGEGRRGPGGSPYRLFAPIVRIIQTYKTFVYNENEVKEKGAAVVGHREQLLIAARRCLEERGYARTTARDLVAASGTNLASIGYHFGSKEALLNQAMFDAFTEYTEMLTDVALHDNDDANPVASIRTSWELMVQTFTEIRPLLVAFVEAMAQSERNPELRSQLAAAYEQLRTTIATVVLRAVPGLPPDAARTVASFLIMVSDGLMVQWLLDPAATPGGGELFDAAQLIFWASNQPA